MTDRQNKRPAPFSLRLSFEERTKLERLAAGESLSSFIKRHVFTQEGQRNAAPPTKRGKAPVKDHILLGQVLASLGRSRLSQNLNQLAKAVNTGNLPLAYDVERDLRQACGDVHAIRFLLMRALGMNADDEATSRESAAQSFTRSSLDARELGL
ncbi:hypothetical protein [Hyphobacterium indicum]|uniref:hypothetical protein n=1 Tax=Hyphobacterium indicum TaxID=2162714 RepID=UPI0018EFDD9B|nr:hypothetical protein [Hyphobacterium indicum]